MSEPRDPQSPAQPAGPTPGTWVIGRVKGIKLTMRFTWLPVAVLLAFGFASIIGAQFPELGSWRYVAAFAFVVTFTLSILLHELAHALVAMRFGIPVTEINLGFFAAGTHIEGERKTPFEEFAVSVVGPLASLLVGGLAYLGSRAADEGVAYVALFQLALANLIVGVTNLLPGLPLDGGWVLRAFVWKVTGNMHTGTVAAAWAGRIIAILVLAAPVILEEIFDREPTIIDFIIALAVGFFLWMGSTASLMQAGSAQVACHPGPRAGSPGDRRPRQYADLRGRSARRGSAGRCGRGHRPRRQTARAGLGGRRQRRRPGPAPVNHGQRGFHPDRRGPHPRRQRHRRRGPGHSPEEPRLGVPGPRRQRPGLRRPRHRRRERPSATAD